MKVWREGEGKGGAVVKKALGRYDSHVNVLKVCDNGLLHRLSKGGRRENHNLHLKLEPSASKLRGKVMCLLVTIMKMLVATC